MKRRMSNSVTRGVAAVPEFTAADTVALRLNAFHRLQEFLLFLLQFPDQFLIQSAATASAIRFRMFLCVRNDIVNGTRE